MKKYFVLALVLMAFVVAPVMSDATLSGRFSIGGIWDISEQHYLGRINDTRVLLNSKIDDYNSYVLEFRNDRWRELGAPLSAGNSSGSYRSVGGNNSAATFADNDGVWVRPYLHRAVVTTDWAKYFEFADVVGLKTEVGYNSWSTFDRLSYTIYDIGGQELGIRRDMGFKISFDIMGIVKPYFAKDFLAYTDKVEGEASSHWLGGVGVDFKPVWVEAFFIQDGASKLNQAFNVEAEFAMEVADGMNLKVGGVLDMRNNVMVTTNNGLVPWNTDIGTAGPKPDEWNLQFYKILAGFNAYGADLGIAFLGGDSDLKLTGALAVSVKYDVTKFFGVQGGGKFAFSDYSEFYAGKESFLGAEFGVYIKPGKVNYTLGYVILNEKALGAYATEAWGLWGTAEKGTGLSDPRYIYKDANNYMKGGLYFGASTRF